MWFRIVPVFREVVSSWIYLFGVEGSDEGVVHFFDYRRVEFDPIAPAAIPAQLGYETDCVHGDTAAIRRWLDCGLHNEATLAAAINECANRKSFRWPNFGESHVHVSTRWFPKRRAWDFGLGCLPHRCTRVRLRNHGADDCCRSLPASR